MYDEGVIAQKLHAFQTSGHTLVFYVSCVFQSVKFKMVEKIGVEY